MCVSGYCVQEEDQIFRNGGSSQACVCVCVYAVHSVEPWEMLWYSVMLHTLRQKTEIILITDESPCTFHTNTVNVDVNQSLTYFKIVISL